VDDRQGWKGAWMKRGVGFGVCKSLIYIETLNPTVLVFLNNLNLWCRVTVGFAPPMKSIGYKAKSDKADNIRRLKPTAARPSGMSGFPLGNPTSDALEFSEDLNGKILCLND
jgi:hypothetical protein